MLKEVQLADPGQILAYSDRDIFTEVGLTNSRHVAAVNAPNPGGSWSSCPIECWASESEQDSAMDPYMEG